MAAYLQLEQYEQWLSLSLDESKKRRRSSYSSCLAVPAVAALCAAIAGYTLYLDRSSSSSSSYLTRHHILPFPNLMGSVSDDVSKLKEEVEDSCQVGTWSPSGLLAEQSNSKHGGFYGEVGVLYSISGPPSYAQSEFLPLIKYLKNGLGIPDATERDTLRISRSAIKVDATSGRGRGRGLNGTTFSGGAADQKEVGYIPPPTRWALVTEQHLCRTDLKPILPFFDVVTVVDLDTAVKHQGGTTNERWQWRGLAEESSGARRDASTNTTRGDNDDQDDLRRKQKHDNALHRAKAVKVLAMSRHAPFENTIFIDLDMVPCSPTFAHSLLKTIGQQERAGGDSQRVPFDVALPYASHIGTIMPPVDTERHYQRGGRHEPSGQEEKGGRGANQHNTACVVLNMTSDGTRELLRWYEYDFFNIGRRKNDTRPLPLLDQPSFGRALLSMWKEDTNSGSATSRNRDDGSNLRHIDLDIDLVCRKGSRNKRKRDKGVSDLMCGASNDCLLIHKPDFHTLEGPPQPRPHSTDTTPNRQTRNVALLKIPKTAGASLKKDIPFFFKASETCLGNLTDANNALTSIVTMMRSPRDHVLSQYMHCRFRPTVGWPSLIDSLHGGNDSNATSTLIDGLDSWLSHMLDPATTFETLKDSFSCYTPWNLQSRMLTCSIALKNHNGAQIIRRDYHNEGNISPQPKEPALEAVITALHSLLFVGLTGYYKESVCMLFWIHKRRMPHYCECSRHSAEGRPDIKPEMKIVTPSSTMHHETHGVPHLLNVNMLPESIIAKIDRLTVIDKQAYGISRDLFLDKLRVIENQSGVQISCQL